MQDGAEITFCTNEYDPVCAITEDGEATETFSVVLNGATLNGAPIAASGSATITINDNDPPPNTNLLVNGSFESTTVPVGQYAAFTAITGWTAITGGTIELWNAHNGITGNAGANYAELDYAGARDGFYQDVQTTAGQSYALTFDTRQRPGGGVSTAGIEIVWNGTVVATTAPNTTTWTAFTVNVTGTGALDRLTIREVASQSSDGLGALIDNFRLVATPADAAVAANISQAAKVVGDDETLRVETAGDEFFLATETTSTNLILTHDQIPSVHEVDAPRIEPTAIVAPEFWTDSLVDDARGSPVLERASQMPELDPHHSLFGL